MIEHERGSGYLRLAEILCAGKEEWATPEGAARWAARHYDCHVCQSGARFEAYLCQAPGPKHHHVGHIGVRR